jgi:hypothetical protein
MQPHLTLKKHPAVVTLTNTRTTSGEAWPKPSSSPAEDQNGTSGELERAAE